MRPLDIQPVATAGDRSALGARPPPFLDQGQEGVSAQTRRITADSFRALIAKLTVKSAAGHVTAFPAQSTDASVLKPADPIAEDRTTDAAGPLDSAAGSEGQRVEAAQDPEPDNGTPTAPDGAGTPETADDAAAKFSIAQDQCEPYTEFEQGAGETDHFWQALDARASPEAEPPARITVDLDIEPPPAPEGADLIGPLAERLGPAAPLLKKSEDTPDPFALPLPVPAYLQTPEIPGPDPASAELTRSLLEIMSAPTGASQPQERALAADTLLRLIPKMTDSALIALSERASLMESAPPLLVACLIRDPRPEVAAPLLERGGVISDQDLIALVGEGDAAKQRMIACRRSVSPALADALVATGEPSVLLALLRNPGASLSHEAFYRLSAIATRHAALQAPLATRADTPAPVAFELFWSLPPELRRYVLSRFLTESQTLSRILKIAVAVDGIGTAQPERSAPARADPQCIEELIVHLEQGSIEHAAALLVEIGGICEHSARRILADTAGEALTVMLKALGLSRAGFAGALERLRAAPLGPLDRRRPAAELKAIFDTLSFSKTRVLLTYWDWAAQKTGPYTKLAA